MLCPDTKEKYDSIVSELADEFRVEIDNGAARSVAGHMIATFEIIDGTPTVLDAVEYEGGPLESIDECLDPYSVLQYSEAGPLPGAGGCRDVAAGRAAEALTLDLLDARDLR